MKSSKALSLISQVCFAKHAPPISEKRVEIKIY
jgi:hypothetical protein